MDIVSHQAKFFIHVKSISVVENHASVTKKKTFTAVVANPPLISSEDCPASNKGGSIAIQVELLGRLASLKEY